MSQEQTLQKSADINVAYKTPPIKIPGFVKTIAAGLLSIGASVAILSAIWMAAAALSDGDLPMPWTAAMTFWDLVSNPFYDNGPNDKGIGLQLFYSFKRVFIGFSIGSMIAVPLGVLLGLSSAARRVIDPIVQLLRPVSPLAWFPIGLAAFSSAGGATIFMIFITSLWPTVINTMFGVSSMPKTYKNIGQMFKYSKTQYLLRIVLPFSLPHILTGLRLSMGIAWMVIVAGEMLSGGTGIGFFVWDSWNALNLSNVISAIILIGIVGIAIDRGFAYLANKASYGDAV